MTFTELQMSLKVFGLEDRATLKEIKARHRELVKRYHPDTGKTNDSESIQKVNAAYRVLLEYVESYQFSFSEEEFYEQNAEERLRRQFFDESMWKG